MAIIVNSGLILPAPDVEALIQGKIITILTTASLNKGGEFALYPSNYSLNQLPNKQQYCIEFLSEANNACQDIDRTEVSIKAWATCQHSHLLTNEHELDALASLTIWTSEGLKETLSSNNSIFLTYVRVCLLGKSIKVPAVSKGKFARLPQNLNIVGSSPVIKDVDFKRQMENLRIQIELPIPPPSSIDAKSGSPKINWIENIVNFGNNSKAQDEGRSNYQAGTDFENIVKQALDFLGFKVDYTHKGGAGGLNLLCLEPYALFGECKAGKKIPNDTAVQLLNLGTLRKKELFPTAVKLIIGAGEPTPQLEKVAKLHGMAIINPRTLQKLVQLKCDYSGSVNLIELKQYFVAGQSNFEIEKYIEKVNVEIEIRSHVVQVVKRYLPISNTQDVDLESLSGAYHFSNPPQHLSKEELRDLLIELSSPLAGYLRRVKGEGRTGDRFYFLRDLPFS